jgi:hypothetical protein
MGISAGPNIVRDSSLVLDLDASDRNSYISGSLIWKDVSGNNLNGTLSGSTLPVFDGTNNGNFYFSNLTSQQQIYFGNSPILAPGPNISVFMWVKPYSTPTQQQTWSSFALLSGSATQPVATGWRIALTTANLLRIQLFSGSNNSGLMSIVNGTPTMGSWNHVGFTLSGSIAYTYLNGQNVGSGNSSPSIPIIVNSGSLVIGYEDNKLGNLNYTSGSISNLQLYNKPLSTTEVTQNYNALKSRFGLR